jgi:hypothetical protein
MCRSNHDERHAPEFQFTDPHLVLLEHVGGERRDRDLTSHHGGYAAIARALTVTVIDGDGLGAGVVDILKHRNYGRTLHEFHGGATASDCAMYFNVRTEVWGWMRDWLKAGAEIPDDPELAVDLTTPGYDTTRAASASTDQFSSSTKTT